MIEMGYFIGEVNDFRFFVIINLEENKIILSLFWYI